ncbi:hypothetical protein RQP46_005671 [Phenoliferia psychrophenolica]
MSLLDLPPEVLCLILELGSADLPSSGPLTRSSFLLSTSVVCRAMRWPSQSTLLGTVALAKADTANKWLHTTHGEVAYPTWDLELHGIRGGKSGVSAQMASKVLSKAFGVRRLELRDFGRMSVRVLQNDGLRQLTSLHLLTDFPDKPLLYDTLSLPFHLSSLYLFNSSYRPELIHLLFRSASRTLRTLSLSVLQSAPSYPALVTSIPLVSSTLRTLNINHRPSTAFIDSLATCTALLHLATNSTVDIGAVLDAVQCPLETLRIELDYSLEETLRVLHARMGAPSMTKLRRLTVKVLIEGVGDRLDQLRYECHHRTVELVVEMRGVGGMSWGD